ncbi:MAG: nitroreductase [candidate division Zixibacteria bacterium]|nr:nitroreductase [candidate division Zixibacteria bacterium]
MNGVIFFQTKKYEEIREFYVSGIGCELWLEQAECFILKSGNQLIGFCDRDSADTNGVITFFFDTKDEVDDMYRKFKSTATSEPADNAKYHIYNFFAKDPEGRNIEFQYFDHRIAEYMNGDELLLTRRSVRKFDDEQIDRVTLNRLFELCRWAPTSHNCQSYYFRIIGDKSILQFLSETRGSSTAPIGRAPVAVAICVDPGLTKRPEQDGCIAAYHFILSAWYFGLGTCWIAAMDRDDVKEKLEIPKEHYIATVTPVGYPVKRPPKAPERKEVSWFLRDK